MWLILLPAVLVSLPVAVFAWKLSCHFMSVSVNRTGSFIEFYFFINGQSPALVKFAACDDLFFTCQMIWVVKFSLFFFFLNTGIYFGGLLCLLIDNCRDRK